MSKKVDIHARPVSLDKPPTTTSFKTYNGIVFTSIYKKGGWNKPHPPCKNMIYYNDFTDKVKHRRRTRLLLELPKYGGTSTMDKP